MSTLSTANIESKAANTPPVIKDLNGTECGQFVRAWVNFNGTGTVAIRDSFNVSSITDNGTGDYTANFATALANANYCISGMAMNSNNFIAINNSTNPTVSAVRVAVRNHDGAGEDGDYVCIAIHGG